MKDTFDFLNKLLNRNDIIVIACSGGPDSMCLLHVLNTLKAKLNLTIICAHINHGLRQESKSEAKFVEEYCLSNNLIFEYKKIDKYKNNKFSEQEAREKRYLFFDEVIHKYNAKYLMTAHHGDDLIETVLMRIVRGSNLKGYAGITKVSKNENYSIIRPLLNSNKEEILKYLKENNIDYVLDKSNTDEKYTRNRYRKHMLPMLKKEDDRVHLKFLKYSEELDRCRQYINKLIQEKTKDICVENYIVINKLLEEDEYLQEKIIEYIIENIQKEQILNINDKQFKGIMNIIKSKNNKQINLANGFIARKSYNRLYIEKLAKETNIKDYSYVFNDKLILLDKYVFEKVSSTREKNNFVIRLNSKEISLPLIIRNKQPGDKMSIKNLTGSQKIKNIFINSKLDVKKRDEYPIVTDSNNTIIWVPGIKKSIFDKEINEKYDIIIKYGGKYE